METIYRNISNRTKGIYLLWTLLNLTLLVFSYSIKPDSTVITEMYHSSTFSDYPPYLTSSFSTKWKTPEKGEIFFPFTYSKVVDFGSGQDYYMSKTFVLSSYDFSEFFVYAISPVFIYFILMLTMGDKIKEKLSSQI